MVHSKQIPPRATRRRTFLAHVGGLGAVLAGAPLGARSRLVPAPTPTPGSQPALEGRIGLIVPPAPLAQGRETQFQAGFQLALQQGSERGILVSVDVLPVSAGVGRSSLRRAAQRLLVDEGADMVVALGATGMARHLAQLFSEAERCLILVDGGASLVRPSDQSPNVFFNTLGHWQSSWALGRWAAGAFQGPGYLVSSGFEGGLDALRAFRQGLDSLGGSEAGFTLPRAPLAEAPLGTAPAKVVADIQQQAPAFTAAFLEGADGLEFLRAYSLAGLQGRIPLLVSTGLAEAAALAPELNAPIGMVSAGSWTRGLDTASNRAFLAAYRKRAGEEAGPFALLGYDTALMLLNAVPSRGGLLRFAREALEGASWQSPRGEISFDPETHASQPQVRLSRLQGGPGAMQNVPIQTLKTPRDQDPELSALRQQPHGPVLNPYPFV